MGGEVSDCGSTSHAVTAPADPVRAVVDKTPKGIAHAVALTFLGERADKWPAEKPDGMANFFSKITFKPTGEWKEEIVFFDPRKAPDTVGKPAAAASDVPPEQPPAAAGVQTPHSASLQAAFPDGKTVEIPPGQDPRQVFADWLITPENSAFSRNIVNSGSAG